MLIHISHLPAQHESAAHAIGLAGSQIARALLVLAAFAVVSLLAAVLTRSTIGTTATAAGAVIAMLIAASLPAVGRGTPATWVQSRSPARSSSRTARSRPTSLTSWTSSACAAGSRPSSTATSTAWSNPAARTDAPGPE